MVLEEDKRASHAVEYSAWAGDEVIVASGTIILMPGVEACAILWGTVKINLSIKRVSSQTPSKISTSTGEVDIDLFTTSVPHVSLKFTGFGKQSGRSANLSVFIVQIVNGDIVSRNLNWTISLLPDGGK